MKTYSNQDWFDVVARTAAHGLVEQRNDKQQLHKWLAVWSIGLVGEIQEVIDAEEDSEQPHRFDAECGDVFWYLAANVMLLSDLGCEVYNLEPTPTLGAWNNQFALGDALRIAIVRLEIVKKIIRDDRPIDSKTIGSLLDHQRMIYLLMMQVCNFDKAIAAVEEKLLKRYPNGYTAEQSINRTI